MKLIVASTIASLLVHPVPIDDWEPPASLLTGCVRSGQYTVWHCSGLGPAARAGMPDAPPPAPAVRPRHSALAGVPATLREAASRLERGLRDNDAAQVNAARAALLAAVARLDETERSHK